MSPLVKAKKILFTSFLLILILACTGSIISGQLFAPKTFIAASVNKQKPSIALLRAVVRSGDRYLVERLFKNSLQAQYPLVLDTYLREDDLLIKLQSLMERNPKSRDVLVILSRLHSRLGDTDLAKYYLEQAKLIDPVFSNFTDSAL